MRTSRFLAVFFTILFTSNAAIAECVATGCTNRIDTIFIHNDGIFIRTDGDETLLNCTLEQGAYIYLKSTHPNYDAIAAALFTFYTTGATVFLRTNEGSPDCSLNYIRIER